LEKDIRTDLFQCALILITTIALLIIPFQNGNPFPAILSLPDTYFNGTGYGIAFLIVALLAPLPSFIVRYDMWQRIIAAKNTKTAQKMLKFLAGGIVLFFAIFTFLGMYIQSQYHLSSSEMDNALFMLLSSHSYFYAIIFVCILAAVLSSADTMLNVASLSFSKFCFKKDWKKISATTPETTQEHISLKRKMIIVTIGIGIISVVVGYLLQDIVSLLIGAVSALTVLFPVIFNILL
jgi:Na+/proline symporter